MTMTKFNFLIHLDLANFNPKYTQNVLKNKAGIYMYINKSNGKAYIGSSNNLLNRFYNHKHSITAKDKKGRPLLAKALAKYGIESFDYYVLELVKYDKFQTNIGESRLYLLNLELKYILDMKPAYNMQQATLMLVNDPLGEKMQSLTYEHSLEIKSRISKGNPLCITVEVYDRYTDNLIGTYHSMGECARKLGYSPYSVQGWFRREGNLVYRDKYKFIKKSNKP